MIVLLNETRAIPAKTSATSRNLMNLIAACNSLRRRFHLFFTAFFAVAPLALCLMGCDVERRKSDAELGLNPQQAEGRKTYDRYCDQCHEPYASRGKKGPGLKGVFKKQFLPETGLPANDDRVGEIIRFGRSKMPAYGRELTDQQIQDLLAYMHTL
jgi:mono/diheme cytochrome c family protein